ncbi:MAG: hypothetical protein BWK73_37145 [Thiothrix lacustris]|uniref:Uncharacterized protein n=1 Tax=Thiothrix lacustris TaxID=525917 RepID=A0A1Y1QFL5_9GAMM|nr:MAG: hypothetical protein BWK73_37145 [Thiothrix lacustris]
MKKQLLTLALLTAIAAPSAFAEYVPADATKTQQVSVTVPEVALLAVAGSPSLTCAKPAAGANFNCTATTPNSDKITYAITANVEAIDSPTLRQITAKVTSIPASWKLSALATTAPGGTAVSSVSLTTTATNLVTDIGNIASTGGAITYTLEPAVATTAMAYSGDGATAQNIEVTYTLTDDAAPV